MELENQIKNLKKKKTAGEDQVKNEAWVYCTKKAKLKLLDIIQKIWKGEGLPKSWKRGVIVPIYKKGDKDKVTNYRGITLLNTAYKIYAMIIEERLKQEIEKGKILPDTQAGFRKNRSTMDNIYILNYAIKKEINKKGRKVYAFFADLKAAFDIINREKLWAIMKRKGINRQLVRRLEEIYEETINTVLIDGTFTKEFWTNAGVRQGCPLSPTLFAIYIADLEEVLRKGQTGGLVVGREKLWSLAYADDIVLVAKEANELREMIRNFSKFLEKRELILSAEKSKVMTFKKGGGRRKKERWPWKEGELEEVDHFKYLGFTLQRNNKTERHIKETVKKSYVCYETGVEYRAKKIRRRL